MTRQQKPKSKVKTYKGGKIRKTEAGTYAADIHIDHKRRRKTFETEEAAKQFIDGLTGAKEKLGSEAFSGLTVRQAQDARDALHLLDQVQAEVTLYSLAEAYVQEKQKASSGLSIKELYDIHIQDLESRRRARTVTDKKNRLGPFVLKYGDRTPASLTATEVTAFLNDRGHQGRNLRNDQIAIQSLMNWIENQSIRKANAENKPELIWKNNIAVFPASDWETSDAEEVGTVSNETAHAVLRYVEEEDPKSALVLALGLLAGIRSSEICDKDGLLWENIDLQEKEITITKTQAKTKHGRTVEINDALFEWLQKYEEESGRVCRRWNAFNKYRRQACEALGVEWPHNAARHTFASNFCKLHGERAAADALGHVGSVDVLLDHYRGVMQTKAKAKAFFDILLPS